MCPCHQFLGDPSEEDPPVPIPNTVVKPLSPDGTARASVWESRKSPGIFRTKPDRKVGLFCSFFYPFTFFGLQPAAKRCYSWIAFDKLPRVWQSVSSDGTVAPLTFPPLMRPLSNCQED